MEAACRAHEAAVRGLHLRGVMRGLIPAVGLATYSVVSARSDDDALLPLVSA